MSKKLSTAFTIRLRTSSALSGPYEKADQIGGWITDGVGQGYGDGYPIEVLDVWVSKVVMSV